MSPPNRETINRKEQRRIRGPTLGTRNLSAFVRWSRCSLPDEECGFPVYLKTRVPTRENQRSNEAQLASLDKSPIYLRRQNASSNFIIFHRLFHTKKICDQNYVDKIRRKNTESSEASWIHKRHTQNIISKFSKFHRGNCRRNVGKQLRQNFYYPVYRAVLYV